MSARPSRNPWEQEDHCTRDVAAIELVEDTGQKNNVASAVAAAVGRAIDALEDNPPECGESGPHTGTFKQTLMSATATAVGAVEGTLKGKSLDGALKEAQIIQAYAEARDRNASASLHQAQVDKTRAETAWMNLQNTIQLFRDLGVEVRVTQFPDGRLALTLGDQLAVPIPGMSISVGSQESER